MLVGLSEKQIGKLANILVALPKTESKEQLAEAYSAADVFVHPGVEETFGMTVAEAQACGTPVIVTAGSACAEISDSDAATVVPADLSTLKATIVKLAGGGEWFWHLEQIPQCSLLQFIVRRISFWLCHNKWLIFDEK